jgi:hypothetical protein
MPSTIITITPPAGWTVYPDLPGLEFPAAMEPEFKVNERETASGRIFRSTYWTYPRWHFTLSYEFLRERSGFDEMQQLVAFYAAQYGKLTPFLFRDDTNNVAASALFGQGDGSTVDFALTRTVGGIAEPIGAAIVSSVTVAGAPVTAFTLLDSRVIRFATPPAAGAALRWTGYHWLRCVFEDEKLPVREFMRGLWEAKSVKIKTDKQ